MSQSSDNILKHVFEESDINFTVVSLKLIKIFDQTEVQLSRHDVFNLHQVVVDVRFADQARIVNIKQPKHIVELLQ